MENKEEGHKMHSSWEVWAEGACKALGALISFLSSAPQREVPIRLNRPASLHCDPDNGAASQAKNLSPGGGRGDPLQYACLENRAQRGLAGYRP